MGNGFPTTDDATKAIGLLFLIVPTVYNRRGCLTTRYGILTLSGSRVLNQQGGGVWLFLVVFCWFCVFCGVDRRSQSPCKDFVVGDRVSFCRCGERRGAIVDSELENRVLIK